MAFELTGKKAVLFYSDGAEERTYKYEGEIIYYDTAIIALKDKFEGLLVFPITKCRLKEIRDG